MSGPRRVAVLKGGRSLERGVSLRSGAHVQEALLRLGHDVQAIDAGHQRVFGEPPARDAVRWFSDASALTRYGIETVNYGTSSGLPGPDGENLDIEGLVKIATVYALAVASLCEVAT